MFETKQGVGFLGWAATAVVTLAVAAGASVIVPNLVNAAEPPPAITSANVETSATVDTPAVEIAPDIVVPAPEVVAEVGPEPAVELDLAAAPTARAKAPVVTVPPVTAPTVTAPPVTLPPVTIPALAPRTVPTPAQVQSAIVGISGLVQLPLFFQINAGHVDQVGNQVCTAFDQGQTFAQVKATGLSMVSAYVPVTPQAADYAVRTAVALYCPAYAAKLV